MVNPQFKDAGRAAYEIPDLFRRLGQPDALAPLTEEQRQIADAIQSHAYNASESILDGLEAIGSVMSAAARSDEGIQAHTVSCLADLVKHLAVEMQHLHGIESDMQSLRRQSAAGRAVTPTARQRAVARN